MKKVIDIILELLKDGKFFKNIFILLIIARLFFLEDNTLALIAEIIGGLIIISTKNIENVDQ